MKAMTVEEALFNRELRKRMLRIEKIMKDCIKQLELCDHETISLGDTDHSKESACLKCGVALA